jgi:predicted acyl esterase
MRRFVAVVVGLGSLLLASTASAAIPSVFTETGPGTITCTVAGDGVRQCGTTPRSTTPTFDGVPLDVNVAFPPDPGAGDGNYPLIVWGHGYGGSKIGFGTSGQTNGMRRFTSRGYAVMSITTRGFQESCGSPNSRTAAGAACNIGYVRLMDTRYEVRDYQELAAHLADEDVIDPQRIGAEGGSYGGGLSMALAALKTRKMMPDGSLVPWISPVDNEPMRIAGAVPDIPWTDLTYSLVPNGRTLDYVVDGAHPSPFGVMKQSLVNGLYLNGQNAPGLYAGVPPAPADPQADLTGWLAILSAGEPYQANAESVLAEIRAHHSSYFIDHSIPPAPMLISNGFTDDLFPADEAIRYYNRTKEQYPDQPLALFFGNFGHQRAANRPADAAVLADRENAWLDFYVKGTGPTPFQGVESTTQVCPNTAPSEGPFQAPNWAKAAPGEIRFFDKAQKTVKAGSGSTAIGQTFNPSLNSQPCGTADAADQPGVASYRLPAVAAPGFVMVGSPTVIATIGSGAPNSQLAARLLDVGPDGKETLVDRALYRPDPGTTSRQVFQLHPNAYRFAAGHVPKLEILPSDSGGSPIVNYARPSNNQGDLILDDLQLRLPVLEKPGGQGGLIKAHAKRVVPPGQTLARDFAALGVPNADVRKGDLSGGDNGVDIRIASPGNWEACHATIKILGAGNGDLAAGSKKKKGRVYVLARGKAKIKGGKTGTVHLSLTKKGRNKLAGRKGKLNVTVVVKTKEQKGKVKRKRTLVVG